MFTRLFLFAALLCLTPWNVTAQKKAASDENRIAAFPSERPWDTTDDRLSDDRQSLTPEHPDSTDHSLPWSAPVLANPRLTGKAAHLRNPIAREPAAQERSSSHVLLTQRLSEVPDNRPVHIDSPTLIRLAALNVKPEEVVVDVRPSSGQNARDATLFNNEWTLVKSGKNLTVQAWTTADQALQSDNKQTATVFSNRPPWLPSKNILEVRVPFYAFQCVTPIDGAASNGMKADAANSVVQVATIVCMEDGVKGLVESGLRNKDLIKMSTDPVHGYQYSVYGYNVTVGRGVVHLTGHLDSAVRSQKAALLARQILADFAIPYRVSNEIKVGKLEE